VRVLHVTEAMGGGVVTALAALTRRQEDLGASAQVLFVERADTPSDAELASSFSPHVSLLRLRAWRMPGGRHLALGARIRDAYRAREFDVVHLHSSFAGGIGRLARVTVRGRNRPAIVYSPHGYGFLKLDTGRLKRGAILSAERVLSRLDDGAILVSESERALSEVRVRPRRTFLVRNGVDIDEFRSDRKTESAPRDLPVVAMVGRVSYQKAPWVFAEVARSLKNEARFVWIGSGTEEDVARWLPGDSGVEVTGWLPRSRSLEMLAAADVFLHPTLWEGMPYALIEAQALGLPAVASAVVGSVDIVRDGVTGYLASGADDLCERTAELLRDADLRDRMSRAAREHASSSLTDRAMGEQAIAAYETAIRGMRS
jgi:glycosyltransferase involved in cell wall biosynthesis